MTTGKSISVFATSLTYEAGANTPALRTSGNLGGGIRLAIRAKNLHVHFHTIATDGVFVKTDAGVVRLQEVPPSSKDNLAEIAQRARGR